MYVDSHQSKYPENGDEDGFLSIASPPTLHVLQ